MGSTFIIYRKDYSEKAMKIYGKGETWKPIATMRLRPPSDEKGFWLWLWNLVKDKGGPGTYRVSRTATKGERKGFHPVWMGSIDQSHLTTQRRYTEFKGIPNLPSSRDLFFKNQTERTHFSKYRRR